MDPRFRPADRDFGTDFRPERAGEAVRALLRCPLEGAERAASAACGRACGRMLTCLGWTLGRAWRGSDDRGCGRGATRCGADRRDRDVGAGRPTARSSPPLARVRPVRSHDGLLELR